MKDALEKNVFEYLPKISLPHSNADFERIFSKINNVKTKARNKLITGTNSAILSASEGVKKTEDCTTFNPTDKLLSWMTAAQIYPTSRATSSTSCDTDRTIASLYELEEDLDEDILFDL